VLKLEDEVLNGDRFLWWVKDEGEGRWRSGFLKVKNT